MQTQKLFQALQSADAVVVGAGAGLSTSAGFTYNGERFQKYFSDFIEKYGFTDMYTAGFHTFLTEEEKWAYWSRHIYYNKDRSIVIDADINEVLNELLSRS